MWYAASYYDGVTARVRRVAVAVTAAGIGISDTDGAALADWPAERVVLTEPPRAGEPVRLGLDGTTARLIVDDPTVLEALRPVAPQLYRGVRLSWGGLVRIGAWAGAAAVSLAILVLVVVPLLADQLAAATPESVRQRIGATTLRQLTLVLMRKEGSRAASRAYCSAVPGQRALRGLSTHLTRGLDAPASLRVVVVNSKAVNAFALPGGIVVLTKGLIEHAASPEEVAGVFVHEVGHIVYDHGLRRMYRSGATAVLAGLLIGDTSGGALLTGLGWLTLNLGYSRAAEREADRFAVARLNAANMDAAGFAAFFARLQKQSEKQGDDEMLELLSTHPPTTERIEAVRREARATGKAFRGRARPWNALRRICRTTRKDPAPVVIRLSEPVTGR